MNRGSEYIFPLLLNKMRSFFVLFSLIYRRRKDYDGVSDEEVVKTFLQGEVPAFSEIIERHKDMVFGLCYNIMNDYDEANDCAQDVFIRVHDSLGKFQFRSSLSTWIYRIAMNLCRDRIGSAYRRRVKFFSEPEECDRIEAAYSTPEESYEISEMEMSIRDAIDRLPENERILVVLRDLEGKTYEEIVAVTGLKEGTVKSRLARGRKILRSLLKEVI